MRILFFILLLALGVYSQDVIATDTSGLIVTMKEKYGGWIIDSSCTAVVVFNRMFILVHKDKSSSWFSVDNYSIQIGRIS